MRIRHEDSENYLPPEHDVWGDDEEAQLSHKRQVRRALEDRLERRRLKHELKDYEDDAYDWDELDR